MEQHKLAQENDAKTLRAIAKHIEAAQAGEGIDE